MIVSILEKYAPKKLESIQGQQSAITKLVSFLTNIDKQKKKGIIIYGPSGVGKTSSLYAFVRDYNYELLEINADSLRNKDEIEQMLSNFSKTGSLFGKKKIILIDEAESFSARDRGGLSAVASIIRKTKIPVVLIATDLWDQKITSLKFICESVEFGSLLPSTIKRQLLYVLKEEKVEFEDLVPEFISRNSNGDMRAALIDLEILISKGSALVKEDLVFLEPRFKPGKIFDFVKSAFKSATINEALASLRNFDLDFDTSFLWLSENILNEYKDKKRIAKAYDILSRCDVFRGRGIKRDAWNLMNYTEQLALAGLSSLRNTSPSYTTYNYPSKISTLAKTKSSRNSQKEVSSIIAPKLHLSSLKCQEQVLPYLHIINKNNSDYAEKLFDYLGFGKDEKSFFQK